MEYKQVLVDFGLRVKEERMKKGISQEKLAELAGLHRTYIGMVERAERNLTLTNVAKIAHALNIKTKDLL